MVIDAVCFSLHITGAIDKHSSVSGRMQSAAEEQVACRRRRHPGIPALSSQLNKYWEAVHLDSL